MVQEAPSSNEGVDMITRKYESLVAVKKSLVDDLQYEIHVREPVSVQHVTFDIKLSKVKDLLIFSRFKMILRSCT